MEKEKLIYEINKKEYILLQRVVTSSCNVKKIDKAIEKLGIIEQKTVIHKGGFMTSSFIEVYFLVPIKKIKEFEESFN